MSYKIDTCRVFFLSLFVMGYHKPWLTFAFAFAFAPISIRTNSFPTFALLFTFAPEDVPHCIYMCFLFFNRIHMPHTGHKES